MEIAIIADDTKKELITQFCIAYSGILSKHSICATSTTGAYISEATGLKIEKLLSGALGGEQQIASRISYDEIDILFYFRSTTPTNDSLYNGHYVVEQNLLRLCDVHNTLLATNIATAETIVTALERGDLDYRELINPRSEYNLKKKLDTKSIVPDGFGML
jgi:methylglyoxal synthase